ncbi:MAG: hypothetical protein RLZ56_282 [Bacteroidota bacterium]|jgi:ComF family protein
MYTWLIQIGSCLNHYFKSFLHLLYPHICLQCGTDQLQEKQIICARCETALPFTAFGKMQNSPVEKIFWGRTPVQHVISILFFTKESLVQQIMMELKYHHNKRAGWLMGKLIAMELMQQAYCQEIDYIIPIPISKQKEKQRGYNQSAIIGQAIIDHGIPAQLYSCLVTRQHGPSQTQKNRLQRNRTQLEKFKLKDATVIKGKNIIIIDDVLTTGATLEAACECLLQAEPASIRLATAAYTIE